MNTTKGLIEQLEKLTNKRVILREFSNEHELNEISSDTFKSAINVSKSRGTDRRTYNLGKLYFNQFKGKSFDGGTIVDIGTHNPQQGNYREVAIQVEYEYPNAPVLPDALKYSYIYYDIDKDIFSGIDEVERKDAAVLSKIAQHINPDTKYKETGKFFKIKGW